MAENILSSLKTCRTCRESKETSGFYAYPSNRGGLAHECKNCVAARTRRWYQSNKERSRAAHKAVYEKTKDRRAEVNKVWVAANKERVADTKRRYRERHRERLNQEARARELANPEKRASSRKKYDDANPDARRRITQNRRARIRGDGGVLPRTIHASLKKLQHGKCAVCSCDLTESGYQLDHIIPVARGGAHDSSNMQLLCPRCNQSKGARDPVEFMQSRGFLL